MSRLFAGTPFDIPPRCDRCGKLEEECQCPPEAETKTFLSPQSQTAKVRSERRKHKRVMTVVVGLDPDETDLKDLLSRLQSACGAGGSVQDGQIEIQGDHADRVTAELKRIGFRIAK